MRALKRQSILTATVALLITVPPVAHARTCVTHLGPEGTVITGRSIGRVELEKLNLAKGQPTRKVAADGRILSGETSAQFTAAKPFLFALPKSH